MPRPTGQALLPCRYLRDVEPAGDDSDYLPRVAAWFNAHLEMHPRPTTQAQIPWRTRNHLWTAMQWSGPNVSEEDLTYAIRDMLLPDYDNNLYDKWAV